MIIGVGVDIVKVQKVDDMIRRHGKRFLTRVFTDSEIQYCRNRKRAGEHFAARFAAKEAVVKALRTGIRRGIAWKDIEVVVGRLGQPDIRLQGGAAERAEELGVNHVHLSLSHTAEYTVAQAIAEH